MAKDVVQKEFQGGSLRLVWTLAVLGIVGLGIWRCGFEREMHKHVETQVFAVTPVEAPTACVAAAPEEPSTRRSIRESDFYLVAGRNLPEGTVLMPQDLKVVRMPGLRGYELAFFSPQAVIGMSTAHAVPEGQPVLPYHVEVSLKHRKYHKTSGYAQE